MIAWALRENMFDYEGREIVGNGRNRLGPL